jgi:ParB-like chromosome segregation protein Spo0J
MKSFKQMRLDGELVRADAEKIEYANIHVEPGFNPGDRNEEDEADDEELYQFIIKHGVLALPQLEVRPREGGGVWIVDGHRRHKQIGRAIASGHFKPDDKGRMLISVRQFSGNDLQRLYRIGTSNKHKKMKALQFAELVQRAHEGFGQSVQQIADGMLCSVSTVQQALILAGANHDVHQMVKAGEVSKTVAVKVVKEKGEAAGSALKEARQAARLQGKSKVTAKQVEGNTPADLVRAIQKEIDSGGSFRAEELAPRYAPLIVYLRGSSVRIPARSIDTTSDSHASA